MVIPFKVLVWDIPKYQWGAAPVSSRNGDASATTGYAAALDLMIQHLPNR